MQTKILNQTYNNKIGEWTKKTMVRLFQVDIRQICQHTEHIMLAISYTFCLWILLIIDWKDSNFKSNRPYSANAINNQTNHYDLSHSKLTLFIYSLYILGHIQCDQ